MDKPHQGGDLTIRIRRATSRDAERSTQLGREFRLYATGQAVSIVGDRLATIALVFLVIHLSHAYAPALALFYVCRAAPTFVGGLLVGVLADSLDRRHMMVACDLARALLLILVPTLAEVNLSVLYPMVFALYAFTLVFTTASRAALPDVVPETRILAANSILQGMNNAADLAYAAGGAFVVLFGYYAPLYIDAVTFAFSAGMIYLMHIPILSKRSNPQPEPVLRRIWKGMGFISGHPFLKWSIVAFALAPVAGGAAYVLTPTYARTTLGRSAGLFGPLHHAAIRFSILEIALGIGALAGSALAPRLARKWPRGLLFGYGLVGTGGGYALLAAITNLYAAMALIAIAGACFSIFMVSGMTLNQVLTPSAVRGRVVAARATIVTGALLVGSAIAGPVLLVLPVRTIWLASGLLIATSSLAVFLHPEVRSQP